MYKAKAQRRIVKIGNESGRPRDAFLRHYTMKGPIRFFFARAGSRSAKDMVLLSKSVVEALATIKAREEAGTVTEGPALVRVNRGLLKLAMERTGMAKPVELVDFALRVLTLADPSAEFAKASRGTLTGLELDI